MAARVAKRRDSQETFGMITRTRSRIAIAMMALAIGACAGTTRPAPPPPHATELPDASGAVALTSEQAADLVRRAARRVAEAPQFSFDAALRFDVMQDDGRLLEFESVRRTWVRRPDRLAIASRRDGGRRQLVYDGRRLSVADLRDKVYVQTEAPPTLEATVDVIESQLEFPLPLADLVRTDLPQTIEPFLADLVVVGYSEVAGVGCEHVSLASDARQVELCVVPGDAPLVRKVSIVYVDEPGAPRFTAVLDGWDFVTPVPDTRFSFTPQPGATQTRIVKMGATPGADDPKP
jgi:hypothetical protein